MSPHPVYLYFCLYQVWAHEHQLLSWVVICHYHYLFWCLNCFIFGPWEQLLADSYIFLTCLVFFQPFLASWQNKITYNHHFSFLSSGNIIIPSCEVRYLEAKIIWVFSVFIIIFLALLNELLIDRGREIYMHVIICMTIYIHMRVCVCIYTHKYTHVCMLSFQSCQTLYNPMDSSPPGFSIHGKIEMGFSRQEYWSGLPFPLPGDLPNLGKAVSLVLQVGSLALSHQGSPYTCIHICLNTYMHTYMSSWQSSGCFWIPTISCRSFHQRENACPLHLSLG